MTRLADLGEFGLIARLREKLGPAGGVTLGIGDDCAAWPVPAGRELLVTSDLLLEGVHFRRDWTDLRRLGRKAVSVNLSDIAAMGGEPGQLLLGLGLPETLEVEEIDLLLEGFLEAAGDYGVSLVGGDTCRAHQFLTLAVTAFGTVEPQQLLRRDRARDGDLVFVSGTLGDSALALRLLEAGETPEPFLAERHHNPSARVALGRALAQGGRVHAMIDLSDGLLADLDHLLAPAGLGARLESARVPLSAAFRRAVDRKPEWFELALTGGEDYELLFSAAAEYAGELESLGAAVGVPVTPIGRLSAARPGVQVVDAEGAEVRMRGRGFRHFGG